MIANILIILLFYQFLWDTRDIEITWFRFFDPLSIIEIEQKIPNWNHELQNQ